jgi:hypothetical protein
VLNIEKLSVDNESNFGSDSLIIIINYGYKAETLPAKAAIELRHEAQKIW